MFKSVSFIALSIAIIGCTESNPDIDTIQAIELTEQEIQSNEDENHETTPVDTSKVKISENDIKFCDDLIQELTGIERYVVMQDYTMLSAILEYKGETEKAKAVNEIIIVRDGELYPIKVNKLDSKNGYIEYAPMYAEVTCTATYWKLKDGGRLIATESNSCGPVCESDINFMKFMDGMYNDVDLKDIIPEIDNLKETLYPDYEKIEQDEPIEFKFNLPQKGKNIIYSVYDKELILNWTNEKFEML
jgi:hypothetical protein